MDLFDILYFYGGIVFLIVAIPTIKKMISSFVLMYKENNLITKIIAFNYIIALIISFLGGHIILSPLASIYFTVLYGLVGKFSSDNKVAIAND